MVEQAQSLIADRWKAYTATFLTDDEKTLVAQAAGLMQQGDKVTSQLKEILCSKDKTVLAIFAAKDLYPAIDPISDKLSELVNLQLRRQSEVEQAHADAVIFRIKFGVTGCFWWPWRRHSRVW